MSDEAKQWLFLLAVLLAGVALAAWVEGYERSGDQTDFMGER